MFDMPEDERLAKLFEAGRKGWELTTAGYMGCWLRGGKGMPLLVPQKQLDKWIDQGYLDTANRILATEPFIVFGEWTLKLCQTPHDWAWSAQREDAPIPYGNESSRDLCLIAFGVFHNQDQNARAGSQTEVKEP